MRRIASLLGLAGAVVLAAGAGGQNLEDSERIELDANGVVPTTTSFERGGEWTVKIEGVVSKTDKEGHVFSYDAIFCFVGCTPGGRTYNGLNAASRSSNGYHQIAYFGEPLDPDPKAPQQPRFNEDHVYFFRIDEVSGPLTLQAPPWGYVGDGDLLTGGYTITITNTSAVVEDVRLMFSAKHQGLPSNAPDHLIKTTLEAKGNALVQGRLLEDHPEDTAGAAKGTLVIKEVTTGPIDPLTVLRIGPRAVYGSSLAHARRLQMPLSVRRSTAPSCRDGSNGALVLGDDADGALLRFCGRRYLFRRDLDVRIRAVSTKSPPTR